MLNMMVPVQPYYFEATPANISEQPVMWRLHAHEPECEPQPFAEQMAHGKGPHAGRLVGILYGDG